MKRTTTKKQLRGTLQYRTALILLIVALCGCLMLPILNFATGMDNSLTKCCNVTVSEQRPTRLMDGDVKTWWVPKSQDAQVHITLPQGRITDGIYIKWYHTDTPFTLKASDKDSNEVQVYHNGDLCDGIGCFYSLPENTAQVQISIHREANDSTPYGICYITVAEKGIAADHSEHDWEAPKEKVDALVVSCHQDDEFVYFGGLIPYLLDQGRQVEVAYSANCSRRRYADAMEGLWAVGIRMQPDFLNFSDKHRTPAISSTKQLWGDEEDVIGTYVELLRKRRPDVVFTHDENGERTHGGHMYTSYALRKAVKYAADPTKYPESAAKYGTWQVKKLYLHLYDKNAITMDFTMPLESYQGRSAYDVACEGLSHHTTETAKFKVELGGAYDCQKWGLCYSVVGYDTKDFFYRVDAS